MTDNESVLVQSYMCFSNIHPDKEIILNAGEVYGEKLTLIFNKAKIRSNTLTFRIGLKNIDRNPVWSDEIILNMSTGDK